MAQLTKIEVQQTFEAGDRPTDQNFTDLFDSILFIGESNENNTVANPTAISNNFSVGGTLDIGEDFIVNNLAMFGKASGDENLDKPLQVYGNENETIVFASGSISNVLFEGISGNATSSIKLTDDLASVSFGTHTNKGFLSIHGNDIITYSTGSTSTDNVIFMSGSLGVGITPSTKFHVSSLTSIDSSSLANAHILVGTTALGLGFDTNEIQFKGHDGYVGVISAHDLNFATNATTKMTIKSSGNVGIGTTSPGHPLSVKGNLAIRNSGDTSNVMLFSNTNSVYANPDIQFDSSALLAAEADFIINIDSDNSGPNAKFSIRKDSTTLAGAEIFSVAESGLVSSSAGFEGDGSQLTNITAGNITGFVTYPIQYGILTTNAAGSTVFGTPIGGETLLTFDGYTLSQSLKTGNTLGNGYYLDGQNGGLLSLTNGTSTSNQFVASISGIASTSMTTPGDAGLYIKGRPAQDNKSNPSIILRGEKLNAASSFSDILRIQNYTTTYITVDSTGSMGIGTTSPLATLHVQKSPTTIAWSPTAGTSAIFESNTSNRNFINIVGNSAAQSELWFGNQTNEVRGRVRYDHTNDSLSLWAASTQKLTILQDGRVGIGATSPDAKLEVGTTADTSDNAIRVLSGDGNKAGFEAYGNSQGTGYLYVGQNSTTGGGIRYNGDDSPDVVGATDYTTFFRRNSGTETAVFSYPHNADTVTFYGGSPVVAPYSSSASIRVSGGIGRTAHNVGHLEGSHTNIGDNSAKTNPIYTIGSAYTPTTTTLSNMYGIGYTHATNATFLDGDGGWGMYVAAAGNASVFLGASADADSYFAAGNVGIGTKNPTAKLHIIADNTTRGIEIHNPVATSYAELHLSASREYRVGTAGSAATGTNPGNFYVYDASAGLHRLTISGSGNVGIGITDPTEKLAVNGNIETFGNGNGVRIGFNVGDKFTLNGQDTAHYGLTCGGSTTTPLILSGYFGVGIATLGTEKVRILQNGNVGIGTTNATAKLHIHESTGTSPAASGVGSLIISHGNSGGVSSIVFPSKVNATSDYGFIQYKDHEALGFATGTTGGENSLLEIGTQNDTGASTGDQIAFSTGGTRRLFIQGDGKIGIGTTTPTAKLEVGTTADTSNSIIRVLSGDSNKAGFEAYGSIQGTGYLYVGQSTTFGGGILYNGDDSPDLVGTTHDQTYFFRRSASIDIPVFSYGATSDTVTFYGGIRVTGGIGRTAHNVGHLEGSYNNIGNNDTNTNPIYTIGSGYTPTTTTLSNMYGIGYTRSGTGYASFLDANTSGWGMYVAADGDARVFLGASAGANSYFDAANVGIGTKNPTAKLHVVGTGNITGATTIGGTLNVAGNTAITGDITLSGEGRSIYMDDYDDGSANTRLISRENALQIHNGGLIVGNYDNGDFTGDSSIAEKQIHCEQIRIGTPGGYEYRRIYMNGTGRMFFNQMKANGQWETNAPYIENGDSAGVFVSTFTGQHRNKPSSNIANYTDKIGYIVVSNGIYSNIPENRTKKEREENNTEVLITPKIDEALPIVELSTTANDKKVFGVISQVDDPNSTERDVKVQGGLNYYIPDRADDRLVINSLGEGAVWISNYNGNLENGDYITTSPIEGIGMKQDDDLLHNYTVAKITQDCDFSSDTTDVTHDGQTYKMKLVGCTYHCG